MKAKFIYEAFTRIDISKIHHYVYLTTNNVTKQQYVGDRSTLIEPEKDRYLGSGREIKLALYKYGRRNFSLIVLFLQNVFYFHNMCRHPN